jgi:hypothetical protein
MIFLKILAFVVFCLIVAALVFVAIWSEQQFQALFGYHSLIDDKQIAAEETAILNGHFSDLDFYHVE